MDRHEKVFKAINRLLRSEEILREKQRELQKERDRIKKQGGEDFRMTEVTDRVTQLRKKALECVEINEFMKRTGLSIEMAALVKERHEYLERYDLQSPSFTTWSVFRQYFFGGPKTRFKIFFRDCRNGQFPLSGFTFNGRFPTRGKEKPKTQMPKKEAARMFGFRKAT